MDLKDNTGFSARAQWTHSTAAISINGEQKCTVSLRFYFILINHFNFTQDGKKSAAAATKEEPETQGVILE